MASITVTSGEFLRSYGRYSSAAQREPVAITNHGRESLVLMSAEEYKRLKSRDRQALHPWELSEGDVQALEAAETPAETAEFDHEHQP